MSENYHTPWIDGTTEYKEDDMNIPLSELDTQITQNVSDIIHHTHNVALGAGPYDIGGTFFPKPIANEVMLRYPFPREVVFPAGMTNSQMVSNVAADAEAVFSLQKDDVEFGTATFDAAAVVAAFAAAAETTFTQGEVLTIVAPDPADADLEEIGWSLAGNRVADTTTTTTTSSSTTSSSTTTSSSSSSSSTTSSTTSSSSSTSTSSTTSTSTTTTA